MALFTPSLEHYDFVIHLKPSVLSRYCENVHADPSVLGCQTDQVRQRRGGICQRRRVCAGLERQAWIRRCGGVFGVAQRAVQRLVQAVPRSTRWKCDRGVVQSVTGPRARFQGRARVLICSCGCDVGGQKGRVKLNKEAIMAEIQRLGEGLVDKVELRSA